MNGPYSSNRSGGLVVGRHKQNRTVLVTGVGEGCNSSISRISVGPHCTGDISTHIERIHAHMTVKQIIQVLSSVDEGTLLLHNIIATDATGGNHTGNGYSIDEKILYSSDTDSLGAIVQVTQSRQGHKTQQYTIYMNINYNIYIV